MRCFLEEKKNKGRPKEKDIEKKKNYHIFVNLTKEQKEKIQAKADEDDVSLSKICIQALKAQKVI